MKGVTEFTGIMKQNRPVNEKMNYQPTIYASFLGYIVQAVVNNFVPLLFLHFQSEFGIPLSQITLLITFNFGIQLVLDFTSTLFVDKIGYRASMIIANASSIIGFLLLTFLPDVLPSAFVGILISVMIYAVGGGLTEVLISPIVEACPTDNKETAMSLLHSFYCWGHVGVILISTIFFRVVGIDHWRILAALWTIVPAVDLVAFCRVPIAPIVPEGEEGMKLSDLARNKVFWALMLMMLCAGASEQAVSQWASTFAEKGLGITKTLGDLMGPMFFAIMMGTSRAMFAKLGNRMDLRRFFSFSVVLCIASYLMIVFVPNPLLSLLGCGLCGFSVGIFWPGTFSFAAAAIHNGGTAMYAMFALAGDIGCGGGPTFAGAVASAFGENLKIGIGAAIVFPVLMALGLFLEQRLVRMRNHL